MSRGRNSGSGLIVFGILLCSPLCMLSVSRFIKGVGFDQEVGGRLKRAADSNSIETAERELTAALDGMKRRGCTAGRSHALWYTPDCDVGFWHDNIKSALDELNEFPADADSLTISNQLMQLRETVLDEGQNVSVTTPPNIVVYPNQGLWLAGWVFCSLAGIAGVIIVVAGCGGLD